MINRSFWDNPHIRNKSKIVDLSKMLVIRFEGTRELISWEKSQKLLIGNIGLLLANSQLLWCMRAQSFQNLRLPGNCISCSEIHLLFSYQIVIGFPPSFKSTMHAGSKIVASGEGISKKSKILACIPPFSKPATWVAPTSNT